MEDLLINRLETNLSVINAQLNNREKEEYFFKPNEESWSMIQVLSHLIDEEELDFRDRVFSVLNDPTKALPSYDPLKLMAGRSFVDEDYNEMLDRFMDERLKSVAMLRTLDQPNWLNAYNHPKMGSVSAQYFLTNWIAHDYIHIQQINRLAYQYLHKRTTQDLNYAGTFRLG